MANAIALLLTVGMVITRGGGWRWSWVVVLLAFSAGLCQAEQPKSAGLHWLGLALLVLSVGPVILNTIAIGVRSAAWQFSTNGMVALTGIFILWYLLRLPSFSVGFSSFMNQCMLLGPIVGMGIVIALARAIHSRSWRWWLLAVLGFVPLLASGSRVAALATIAGISFLLIQRKPVFGVLCALGFLLGVYGFVTHVGTEQSSDSLTATLSQKGIKNSRTELWQSRISEFTSSPLFGIGVAMGTGDSASKEEGGNMKVEPGSSYLAVLAMTGGVGTAAFFTALGLLLFGYVRSQRQTGLQRDILNAVGIFLAVHGVAEGWILGFGSPLCFLFWLWLGNIGDAALQPARAMAKLGLPTPPTVSLTPACPRPLATDHWRGEKQRIETRNWEN